ncbi:unnamed protein product, partial [Didymodactylos carnosus]
MGASHPTPAIITGDQAFVTGSTVEKQQYVRHFANEIIQDIDIMIVEGYIESFETLIPTTAPGFVQVKFDGVQRLRKEAVLEAKENIRGVACLNGLKIKEKHAKNEECDAPPFSTAKIHSTTEVGKASVALVSHVDIYHSDQQFRQILNTIKWQQQPEQEPYFQQIKQKYKDCCLQFMPFLKQFLELLNTSLFQSLMIPSEIAAASKIIALTGPAYNHRLHKSHQQQIRSLLDFYDKHKQLATPKIYKAFSQHGNYAFPTLGDNVPCLQLRFWPDDIKPFLERFRQQRPFLYEKIIPSTSMHIIAKWSDKTLPESDKDLEFRYSFSALERLLAENRTRNEEVLNGIARYFVGDACKPEDNSELPVLIPSYFIKTTVLWMSETMNISEINEPSQLARLWLDFASHKLLQRSCPHYFIEKLNILEPYSHEQLDCAYQILKAVDINESTPLKILNHQQQLIEQNNKEIEQFFRQIKVRDFRAVVEDYTQLKKECCWIDDGKENDLRECLFILNRLVYVDGWDKQNWTLFRQLFLDQDESNWDASLFGEEGIKKPSELAVQLMFLSNLLTTINNGISNPTFNGQPHQYDQIDVDGFRNVCTDLLKPETHEHAIITSQIPPFLQLPFSENQPDEMSPLAQHKNRTVLECHPHGPGTDPLDDHKQFLSELQQRDIFLPQYLT